MISAETPRLESRSADQVIGEVRANAELRPGGGDTLAEALIGIFGLYFELIAARLNLSPEKHRLAFLDLLGTAPASPTAARVPLTFVPVQQLGQVDRSAAMTGEPPLRLVVPAGTQVAGVSEGGQGEPLVFETERTLELTSATLERILAHDPVTDDVAEYSRMITQTVSGARPFLDQMRPSRHELYVAWPEAFGEDITSIALHFDIEPGSQQAGPRNAVEWSNPGAPGGMKLQPEVDATEGLTKTGDVLFRGFREWPSCVVDGIEARWLQCKLVSRLPQIRTVRDEERERPPAIRRIAMSARLEARDIAPERGFFNAQALDLSTGFFPLGFDPRFGDAFYLGSALFVEADADITLRVHLVHTALERRDTPDPLAVPRDRPPVVWEGISDGHWVPLRCDDETRGLAESGCVRFRVPSDARPIAVNGIEAGWIRVRVAAATSLDRGQRITVAGEPAKSVSGPVAAPVRFTPAVERVTIDVSKVFAVTPVHSIVRVDDLGSTVLALKGSSPIVPFERIAYDEKALYFGFNAPAGDISAGTSLFFFMQESSGGRVASANEPSAPAIARAEYWVGDRWATAELVDETRGLTRSGNVVLRWGRPWRSGSTGPRHLDWARLVWSLEQRLEPGLVTRVAVNTVTAINAVSSHNELLGSSDHTPHQVFTCARRPVIEDVQLEVREVEASPAVEMATVRAGERQAVSGTYRLESETPRERWIRWHAVEDFSESGSEDRHFILDAWTGTVRFGDGRTGRIPPAGANNVLLRRYRAGGGSGGNVGPGTITELRSTLPYVSGVTNLIGATGGRDPERIDRIIRRGSAWLSHRHRAVTRDDYEDLATAVPGVARAKCMPLRDLDADPDGERVYPGRVSVIVVPEDDTAAPKPTSTQLRSVYEWLAARRPPEIKLTVVGPEYVIINVAAQLGYDDREDIAQIVARCRARLDAYLHPLTGGPGQQGWQFGERPVQSALSGILRGVEGVQRLRSLEIHAKEERPGLLQGRSYLICSGRHDITFLAVPPEDVIEPV